MLAGLNYLAHLFLAEETPASRVGNLLGDFVTGLPEVLRGHFPRPIVQGIIRHRAIDRYTDSHPVVIGLKAHVALERRRFGGVIVDLVLDHFLTRHWETYSRIPLPDFVHTCNTALREYRSFLPPELGDSLEERIEDEWLEHYGTDEGLDDVFHRVALRKERFAPMRGALADLREHRVEFEAGFHDFFPELLAWVRARGPEERE